MGDLSHPSAPAPAGDLARLDPAARDRVASAAAEARAPATRRAYTAQWRRFERWCAARATTALEARPAEVAAYLAGRAERSKLATVRSAAAAIAAACRASGRPDPTKTTIVADTLRGIARQHARQPGAAPRQARALTYDHARELMLAARDRRRRGRGLESEATAARRALVDAVVVALLFCGGLRRAEAAALVWADVEPTERDGQLRVRVRASKANPAAEHEDFRLLVGPFARALEELRAVVGPAGSARVIPLSPYRINERLQALAERAGLAGVKLPARTAGRIRRSDAPWPSRNAAALGRLGWSLRRIERATGVRRETASGYLKTAGVVVRGRGRPGARPANPAISSEVSTDPSPAVRDHPRGLPVAGEHDVGGRRAPARQLRREADPPRVRGHPPVDAGGGGRGREPQPDHLRRQRDRPVPRLRARGGAQRGRRGTPDRSPHRGAGFRPGFGADLEHLLDGHRGAATQRDSRARPGAGPSVIPQSRSSRAPAGILPRPARAEYVQ